MIEKGKYLAVVRSKSEKEFIEDVERMETEGYRLAIGSSFSMHGDEFLCVMGCPEKDPGHEPPALEDMASPALEAMPVPSGGLRAAKQGVREYEYV